MSRKGANIYKRKDGRWEGRYKKGISSDGRTLYGSCYGKTYRETKEKLESLRLQLYFGAEQNEKATGESKLFSVFCDEWILINRNKVKESTIAKYISAVNNHIRPFFGGYKLSSITTGLTAEFINMLMFEKQLSSKTVKDIAVILKSVLKYAARFQIKPNLIEVAVPKYTAKDIRVLSKDEQRRFVEYLITDTDQYKFGVLFALLTGLRIGEVCALRAGDISLPERILTVRETVQRVKNTGAGGSKTKIIFTSPKSDSSARVVPLTNMAYELCRERVSKLSPNMFLLTGSESKFTEPRVLQYQIKKFSRECGIEDLHFHVLRHTFATRCVEVGFEIKTLSEVLGHATPRITLERYVHSSIEFKRQNMAKLEAIGL